MIAIESYYGLHCAAAFNAYSQRHMALLEAFLADRGDNKAPILQNHRPFAVIQNVQSADVPCQALLILNHHYK
jgi:hypothetical protein